MKSKSQRFKVGMLVLLSILLLKAVDVQTNCVPLATAGLLRQTIKLAPHSEFAHNLLGHTYYALNRTDLALHHLCRAEDLAEINDWKRTIRKEPHNVEAYLSLGQACYDVNDFEAGKGAFNQALQIDPNCLDAYIGLSSYYWKIEGSEKALNIYEKVLEIDPENQNAHYMLAVEYAIVGMNEESETEMGYLSYDKRRASALWCMIGNIYRENGSSDRAISAYSRSLSLIPERPEARFNLAKVYIEMGNKDKALAEFEILKGLDTELAEELELLMEKSKALVDFTSDENS